MDSNIKSDELGPFVSKVKLIGDVIDRGVLWIAGALLTTMSITLLVGISMRYLFLSPPIWVEEAVRYFMIWAVCLSMSSCVKRCEHISINFVVDTLPALLQQIIGYVLRLLLIGLFLILIVYGIQLVQMNLSYTSQALEINMGLVLAVVPIGAALMLIQLVINFIVTKSNQTYTGKF